MNFKYAFTLTLLVSLTGFVLGQHIRGNGNIDRETRSVSGFEGLSASGIFDVTYRQSPNYRVEIITDENIMPLVETKVENGVLKLRLKKGTRKITKLEAKISGPYLTSLNLSGAAEFEMASELETGELKLNMSGAAEANIPYLLANNLELTLSGSSELTIEDGKIDEAKANLSGASEYTASGNKTDSFHVVASGASEARVWVVDDLVVNASGASDVYCKGTPGHKSIKSSGSSDVHIAHH